MGAHVKLAFCFALAAQAVAQAELASTPPAATCRESHGVTEEWRGIGTPRRRWRAALACSAAAGELVRCA